MISRMAIAQITGNLMMKLLLPTVFLVTTLPSVAFTKKFFGHHAILKRAARIKSTIMCPYYRHEWSLWSVWFSFSFRLIVAADLKSVLFRFCDNFWIIEKSSVLKINDTSWRHALPRGPFCHNGGVKTGRTDERTKKFSITFGEPWSFYK